MKDLCIFIKKYFFEIVVIIVISGFIYIIYLGNQDSKKNHVTITKSVIQGRIEKWNINRSDGILLKVKGVNRDIIFTPYSIPADTPYMMKDRLAIGDSIRKMPKSDTFYLYKPNGEVFKYTFYH